MAITVNIRYKGKEGAARKFAMEMMDSGVVQKIREEERNSVYNLYIEKEKEVVTGIVQRIIGKNVSLNLGKADAILAEGEMAEGETFRIGQRVKVYVLDVKSSTKGPRINVSRTHPELVKRLFEEEVTEIADGTVEIKINAR